MSAFSSETIDALAEVITGGSANSSGQPIGIYRSGPLLEQFFGGLNVEFSIACRSRLPAVRELLLSLNQRDDGEGVVKRVIEQVTDPRAYLKSPGRTEAVVNHLNQYLRFDGFEVRLIGPRYKLAIVGTNANVATDLRQKATALDLDSVRDDLDHALSRADNDPPGAITAACSTVESVCKCILEEMGQPPPAKQDIAGLVKELQKHLDLSPGRQDVTADIKQILGGLSSTATGIGALRTHAGDAHGRGNRVTHVDARIARLAIHSASTVSLFLIETWQKRKAT